MFYSTLPLSLKREEAYLNSLRDEALRIISSTPPGDIIIHKKNGKTYYGYKDETTKGPGRTERYLSLTDPALPALIHRHCAKKVLVRAERSLHLISMQISRYDPLSMLRLFQKLEEKFGTLVPPAFATNTRLISEWTNKPYIKNSFHKENDPLYPTKKGDIVRSKNECITANLLYDLNIPYKYEYPVRLKNGNLIFIDFLILSHVNGRKYYLEIFGKMSDPSYAEPQFSRIQNMTESGIVPGLNFLMVFESSTSPFNTDNLAKILKETVLAPA